MRSHVYKTWLGRVLLSLMPCAGLVGITLRLLFEWDGFATTEAVGHRWIRTRRSPQLAWTHCRDCCGQVPH